MADATASLLIKGTADVGDAVAGLRQVEGATVNAQAEANGFAVSMNNLVAGLVTAELAMKVLEGSTSLYAAAIQAAIVDSSNLSKRSDVLTASLGDLLTTMGRVAVGGTAASQTLRGLDVVVDSLNERLTVTADTMNGTSAAVGVLVGAINGAVYLANGFTIVMLGLETAFSAVYATMFTVGDAFWSTGRAIMAVAGDIVAVALDRFADLAESAVVLAGSFGVELPSSVSAAAATLRDISRDLDAASNPLGELQDGLVSIGNTWVAFGENTREGAAATMAFLEANNTLLASINRFFGAMPEAEEKVMPFVKTVDLASGAVNSLSDALERLKEEAIARDLKVLDEQAILDRIKESTVAVEVALRDKVQADAAALRAWIVNQWDTLTAEYEARAALMRDVAEKIKDSMPVLDGGAPLLAKDYNAAAEALNALTVAGENFGTNFGAALENGIGSALASAGSLAEFGKAFTAALGQSLVSSGIQTLFEGLKALIPLPGLFNPAAAAVAIPLGGAMIGAGRLMGGKGSAPAAGGRSVGDSGPRPGTGLNSTTAPMNGGTSAVVVQDLTGATIVSRDVDSMRDFTRRMADTRATGAGSTI